MLFGGSETVLFSSHIFISFGVAAEQGFFGCNIISSLSTPAAAPLFIDVLQGFWGCPKKNFPEGVGRGEFPLPNGAVVSPRRSKLGTRGESS